MIKLQFERLKLLLGNKFEKTGSCTVLILGLGGVGGYVVETLVRSGISSFILIDNDKIDITNLNRQIISNLNNINSFKVDEWVKRIKEINKDVKIIKLQKFITADNINDLLKYEFEYAIDCCDTISTKKEFIKLCLNNKKKFISCMGTGKKFHPELLEITDISKTSYDPIAKALRKMLKDDNVKGKIPVVYSKEIPKKIDSSTIPSSVFVPSVAGILCANYIFNLIIGDENETSK